MQAPWPVHRLAVAALRAVLPFQGTLRTAKRRLSPYRDNPDNSDWCITNGLEQIVALHAAGVAVRGATVLEFGSGWLPLIPWLLHLAGAERLILTDIERLMDARTIGHAKALIADRIDDVAAALRVPPAELRTRLEAGFAPIYLVPWNAAAHPGGSVDLIVSRATLEHVPIPALRGFLDEFRRILRPGGAMCHLIDNSDHWQHRDRSRSRVDFLRFDDATWGWRLAQLNPQNFQNRLRHGDYARLFADAGFTTLHAAGRPDPRCLAELATLKLAARFQAHRLDDLAVLTSLFVLRREADGAG